MEKVKSVCLKLKLLCEIERGVGISAVQVGIPWKLFLVKGINCPFIETGSFGYFINCEYEEITDKKYEEDTDKKLVRSIEGCLSLRSQDGCLRFFEVVRQNEIKVIGLQIFIKDEIIIENLDKTIDSKQQSIVFQHEIDHHRGRLISDFGAELNYNNSSLFKKAN